MGPIADTTLGLPLAGKTKELKGDREAAGGGGDPAVTGSFKGVEGEGEVFKVKDEGEGEGGVEDLLDRTEEEVVGDTQDGEEGEEVVDGVPLGEAHQLNTMAEAKEGVLEGGAGGTKSLP